LVPVGAIKNTRPNLIWNWKSKSRRKTGAFSTWCNGFKSIGITSDLSPCYWAPKAYSRDRLSFETLPACLTVSNTQHRTCSAVCSQCIRRVTAAQYLWQMMTMSHVPQLWNRRESKWIDENIFRNVVGPTTLHYCFVQSGRKVIKNYKSNYNLFKICPKILNANMLVFAVLTNPDCPQFVLISCGQPRPRSDDDFFISSNKSSWFEVWVWCVVPRPLSFSQAQYRPLITDFSLRRSGIATTAVSDGQSATAKAPPPWVLPIFSLSYIPPLLHLHSCRISSGGWTMGR